MMNTVEIDGKEFFIGMMHPRQLYQLCILEARTKYKQAQHIIRYNRWAAKQGKPPYDDSPGEIGFW